MNWKVFYIIIKFLECKCLKWAHMIHLGFLKHKLWPKEGLGVKLSIWLRTIKSQESPWCACAQVACHILLEIFLWGLQLCFRPHLNWRFARKVMGLQSRRRFNFWNFRTPTWESWDKMTFGCWSHSQAQRML